MWNKPISVCSVVQSVLWGCYDVNGLLEGSPKTHTSHMLQFIFNYQFIVKSFTMECTDVIKCNNFVLIPYNYGIVCNKVLNYAGTNSTVCSSYCASKRIPEKSIVPYAVRGQVITART